MLAAVTRPRSVPFDSADVLEVQSADDLATASATEDFPGDAVLTFDPANAGGFFSDPFVFAGCESLGTVCAAPPPDVVPGDVALYEGDIADRALLDRIFAEQKIGTIMHFAGSIVVPAAFGKLPPETPCPLAGRRVW